METYQVILEGIDVQSFEYSSFEEAVEGMKRLRVSCEEQFEIDGIPRTISLTIEVGVE